MQKFKCLTPETKNTGFGKESFRIEFSPTKKYHKYLYFLKKMAGTSLKMVETPWHCQSG